MGSNEDNTFIQEEEEISSANNLITSAIIAGIAGFVGLVVTNMRIQAIVGLGDYDVLIDKKSMKMPRYGIRKTKNLIDRES